MLVRHEVTLPRPEGKTKTKTSEKEKTKQTNKDHGSRAVTAALIIIEQTHNTVKRPTRATNNIDVLSMIIHYRPTSFFQAFFRLLFIFSNPVGFDFNRCTGNSHFRCCHLATFRRS